MTTVLKTIRLSGKGIHSGLPVNIVIKPSKKDGIFFRRTDIDAKKLIPATYNNVGETRMRNTTIGNLKDAHVQTIEHLMAALFMTLSKVAQDSPSSILATDLASIPSFIFERSR